MHSTTTMEPFMPAFDGRRPTKDATIWRVSLSASLAFKLICDIGHLYPSPDWRPRIGAMLEADGAWTIYCWPKVDPDSALLLLMLDYGATRLADASRWVGDAWVTGDLLGKVLAALAAREYFDMTPDRKMLADERPGYLLSLERQVAK